ncbi:hypothetical protein CR513_35540, partial [Mucuna pruriens]
MVFHHWIFRLRYGRRCGFKEVNIGLSDYFCRGAVSWQSKLQKCVTLSTAEAEYSMPTKKLEDCCQGVGVVVPPN